MTQYEAFHRQIKKLWEFPTGRSVRRRAGLGRDTTGGKVPVEIDQYLAEVKQNGFGSRHAGGIYQRLWSEERAFCVRAIRCYATSSFNRTAAGSGNDRPKQGKCQVFLGSLFQPVANRHGYPAAEFAGPTRLAEGTLEPPGGSLPCRQLLFQGCVPESPCGNPRSGS